MHKKILAVFSVVIFLFLAGCATTRKGQDLKVQQLESRINYLEAELQKKDEKISSLEDRTVIARNKSLSKTKQKDCGVTKMSTKQIQLALKNAGFYKGAIDGREGQQTKEAIKAFQRANGLKADGIAGQKTLTELKKNLKK